MNDKAKGNSFSIKINKLNKSSSAREVIKADNYDHKSPDMNTNKIQVKSKHKGLKIDFNKIEDFKDEDYIHNDKHILDNKSNEPSNKPASKRSSKCNSPVRLKRPSSVRHLNAYTNSNSTNNKHSSNRDHLNERKEDELNLKKKKKLLRNFAVVLKQHFFKVMDEELVNKFNQI